MIQRVRRRQCCGRKNKAVSNVVREGSSKNPKGERVEALEMLRKMCQVEGTVCAKALRTSVLAARRSVGQRVRWGRSWEPLLVGFEKFLFAAIFSISAGQKQGDQGVG